MYHGLRKFYHTDDKNRSYFFRYNIKLFVKTVLLFLEI